MHPTLEKTEEVVEKLIPIALITLIIIIVLELFFYDFAHEHENIISLVDNLIILLFTVDVIYHYLKVRDLKKFIKEYWLDTLAIFPFNFALKGLSAIARFEKGLGQGQSILHSVLELEKLSKSRRFLRYTKIMFRLPRLLKGIPVYKRKKK